MPGRTLARHMGREGEKERMGAGPAGSGKIRITIRMQGKCSDGGIIHPLDHHHPHSPTDLSSGKSLETMKGCGLEVGRSAGTLAGGPTGRAGRAGRHMASGRPQTSEDKSIKIQS